MCYIIGVPWPGGLQASPFDGCSTLDADPPDGVFESARDA